MVQEDKPIKSGGFGYVFQSRPPSLLPVFCVACGGYKADPQQTAKEVSSFLLLLENSRYGSDLLSVWLQEPLRQRQRHFFPQVR